MEIVQHKESIDQKITHTCCAEILRARAFSSSDGGLTNQGRKQRSSIKGSHCITIKKYIKYKKKFSIQKIKMQQNQNNKVNRVIENKRPDLIGIPVHFLDGGRRQARLTATQGSREKEYIQRRKYYKHIIIKPRLKKNEWKKKAIPAEQHNDRFGLGRDETE